jgi:glycosyltransferase involved in cell wall biosynthesis
MTVVQITESVAQKWCTRITDLSISKENGGLSSARNAGITISKGEYILPWTQMIFYMII